MYLVGKYTSWTGDADGCPNTREFPSFCYESLDDAYAKYEELAKSDNASWAYCEKSYIIEANTVGGFKIVCGDIMSDRINHIK